MSRLDLSDPKVTEKHILPLVYQTKFGEEGNCLAACLITFLNINGLMNLTIKDAPKFDTKTPFAWLKQLEKFLAKHGYRYVLVKSENELDKENNIYEDYYIGIGMSNRGYKHACLYTGDLFMFDPYPDRLLKYAKNEMKIDSYIYFISNNVSTIKLRGMLGY